MPCSISKEPAFLLLDRVRAFLCLLTEGRSNHINAIAPTLSAWRDNDGCRPMTNGSLYTYLRLLVKALGANPSNTIASAQICR